MWQEIGYPMKFCVNYLPSLFKNIFLHSSTVNIVSNLTTTLKKNPRKKIAQISNEKMETHFS